MTELAPTLEALAQAVQAHASAIAEEGNPLVTQALVIYETVTLDEDGTPMRQVSYTIPGDNFAVTGAIGLAEAGAYYVKRDTLGDDG